MKPLITIHSYEHHEPEFLAKVLARAARHEAVYSVDVYCNERFGPMRSSPEGWCEYLLVLKYTGGGGMTIGCIERSAGAEMEFHS